MSHSPSCVRTRERELILLPSNLSLRPGILSSIYSESVTNMPDPRPLRQSVREIDDNSWIIGDVLLLSHTTVRPSSGCFWSDGENAFYTLSKPDHSKHQTRPLSSTSLVQLVHDTSNRNAAWRIGEAFLKVQALSTLSRTPKRITLNYLHDPANGSAPTFPIPHVLYHEEYNNQYYLFTSQVPGDTLEKA